MSRPEHALHLIQEQLKKFEQPNRASVESQGQRLALLENLEKEMGMQETHWQEMKHDLGRDSMSSVQTASPARPSRPEAPAAAAAAAAATAAASTAAALSRESSTRSNIGMERRASRRAKLRTSANFKSSEDLAQSAGQMGANGWRQRLAEAQMEYLEKSPELSRSRGLNFLTLSKDLGSPTPPDTDSSDDEV